MAQRVSWDEYFLQIAALAATRSTCLRRNVGCVLVRDGRIIGEGSTLKVGNDHAEIQAIKHCLAQGESPRGATAYVTLEPCSHHGRTPPCATRLVEEGVARVVAAMVDPYHEVAGQGLALLRAAGIVADVGLLEAEARRVHRGFLSRVERQRPWVTLKAAATLDGKTALLNGKSQWITGPAARADVQALRARSCAILTGSGTVAADNPRLTVRDFAVERQPLRVVVEGVMCADSAEREIFSDGGATLLACALPHPAHQVRLRAQGVRVQALPAANNPAKVDLAALLQQLGREGINEVLVEAGMSLNGALLHAGLVDELVLYLAPVTLGHDSRGLFGIPPLPGLEQAQRWRWHDISRVGDDIRLTLRRPPEKT